MANPIKRLLGQTAVYGLSSIIGRLLNYLLVPLYTYVFADPADYGVVSELYAWVAFLKTALFFSCVYIQNVTPLVIANNAINIHRSPDFLRFSLDMFSSITK